MPVSQPENAIITAAHGAFADAIFSTDGTRLFTVSGNTISVINVQNGATVASYTIGTQLGAVAVSLDGHYLAIVEEQPAGGAGIFYRLDFTTGSIGTFTLPGTSALHDIAFLANGSVVVSQEVSAPLRVVNVETGDFYQPSPPMRANATISVSADGTYIIAQPPGGDWPLHAYDSQTGSGYAVYFDPYAGAGIGTGSNIGAVSPDGSLVVQGAPFRVYQGNFSSSFALNIGVSNPAALTFSPDGSKLYVLDSSIDKVVVVSTSNWQVLASYPIEADALHFSQWSAGAFVPGEMMRISADGHFLSIITPTGIQLVNLTIVVEPNYEGGPGDDTITGSDGVDQITGAGGNDALSGAGGNDLLLGGEGNDHLNGGTGNDTLTGGSGNDIFYFGSPLEFFNADHITDLSDGDTIQLETVAFTALQAGQLDPAAFHIGDAAAAADDRIIYNSATGQIMYDPDGTGDAPRRLIATVDVGTAVSAASFVAVTTGTVTVQSGVTYTLAENELNLELTGNAAINGTGNGLDNQITGNGAANQLMGLDGADTLVGNGGDDYLDGGGGADQLIGGPGNDTYVLGYPGFFLEAIDTITELAGEGVDTIVSSFSVYQLPTEVENITLTGFAQSATGNDRANILIGNGAINTMNGGGGDDQLFGNAGNDSLVGDAGNDLLDGGDGIDSASYSQSEAGVTVSLAIAGPQNTGSAGVDTLVSIEILGGSDYTDYLTAGAAGNSLFGWFGNDFLFGGAGDDELDGGQGSDVYVIASGSDHWSAEFVDRGFDEGAVDEVRFSSTIAGTLTMYAGDTGIERIVIGTGTAPTAITSGLTANNVNASALGYGVTIVGNDGSNQLLGTAAGDQLHGNAGNDQLSGGGGDDSLSGDAGDDALDGGGGWDTATYASAGFGVSVSLAIAGAQNTGGGGIDTLSTIERVVGSAFSDLLAGDAANNELLGGGGDDGLYGGAGNDTLNGGGGHDTLSGQAGNDLLDGAGGNDTLDGGAGSDTATYALAGAGVTVNLSLSVAQNIVGAEYDTLVDVENLTGSAFNDVLTGSAANNLIEGGAGTDTMDGGSGSDVYVIHNLSDHIDAEISDSGSSADFDTVVLDTTAYGTLALYGADQGIEAVIVGTLTADPLNPYDVTGTAALNVDASSVLNGLQIQGNAGTNVIWGSNSYGDQIHGNDGGDTLFGSGGNDHLYGGNGIDWLHGGDHNDTLDGGQGADTMYGGSGSDSYYVDSLGDAVIEGDGDGDNDRVHSTISWTLGENLEGLVLVGGAVAGTGNALGNGLVGNDAANTLSGLGGNDFIDGGAGADVLDGGDGNDSIVFDAADNAAQVTGGAGTDTLVFNGSAPTGINLTAQGFELAEVRLTDTAGNPWSSITKYYNSSWSLLQQVTINDDGSRTIMELDPNNHNTTREVWSAFDALGRLSSVDQLFDNDTRTFINLDEDNSQSWNHAWFSYDAQGRLGSQDVLYDDGTRTFINLDEASAHNWAQDWFAYDAQGRLSSQDVIYDNGTRTFINLDQDNSQSWNQAWFSYDTQGRLDTQDVLYDDGSRIFYNYDQAGTEAFVVSAILYNSAGTAYQQVITWDDGSTSYYSL